MLQHALSTEADTPTRATRGHGSGIGDASLQLMQVFFFATYADVAYMGIEEMAWSTQQEDQTGSY